MGAVPNGPRPYVRGTRRSRRAFRRGYALALLELADAVRLAYWRGYAAGAGDVQAARRDVEARAALDRLQAAVWGETW